MSGAFESYKLFHGLRLHFTSPKYDFIKFRGKTRVSAQSFDKRNDRYFYHALRQRYKRELKEFYISVFTGNLSIPAWAGEMMGQEYDDQFQAWLARRDARKRYMTDDVKVITEFMEDRDLTFRDLVVADGDKMPVIIRLQEQNFISLETVVAINKLTSFSTKAKVQHPFWGDKKLLLEKYEPFIFPKASELGWFGQMLRNSIE